DFHVTGVQTCALPISTTEYTPATGGPITEITTINPLDHVTTQILEPLRGQAVESIDANGNVTEMAYDALGRLATGWAPDRARDEIGRASRRERVWIPQ